MFRKPIDLLCVGDVTTDAFIRLKDAHINCKINQEDCELCLRFGDKVPFEYVKIVKAVGNAANVAVAASRLGLNTSLLSNIGDDQSGKESLSELMRNKVAVNHVTIHKNKSSNYHFVLWYGADRTILVNHVAYEYKFPSGKSLTGGIVKIAPPKWLYMTSIGPDTMPYHMEIADYLDTNPLIKLAFQPGTYQIKLGRDELRRFYKRADVLVVNMDEAKRILGKDEDPKILMKQISALGPKLVAITNGPKGSYLFDGDHYYHMSIYPDPKPPLERTGCGDAWAATFVSALAMGKTPLEALTLAPINSMSVAQYVGSQEGLLKMDHLDWWMKKAPEDYKPREI